MIVKRRFRKTRKPENIKNRIPIIGNPNYLTGREIDTEFNAVRGVPVVPVDMGPGVVPVGREIDTVRDAVRGVPVNALIVGKIVTVRSVRIILIDVGPDGVPVRAGRLLRCVVSRRPSWQGSC